MGNNFDVVCRPSLLNCEQRAILTDSGFMKTQDCSDKDLEFLKASAKEKAIELAKIVFGWKEPAYNDATIHFVRFDEQTNYVPGSNIIDEMFHTVTESKEAIVTWTLSGKYYCEKVQKKVNSPLAQR